MRTGIRSRSLLDQHIRKLSEVSALVLGHSDHKLISAVRFAKVVKIGKKFVTKRSYTNFSEQNFLKEVEKIRW